MCIYRQDLVGVLSKHCAPFFQWSHKSSWKWIIWFTHSARININIVHRNESLSVPSSNAQQYSVTHSTKHQCIYLTCMRWYSAMNNLDITIKRQSINKQQTISKRPQNIYGAFSWFLRICCKMDYLYPYNGYRSMVTLWSLSVVYWFFLCFSYMSTTVRDLNMGP